MDSRTITLTQGALDHNYLLLRSIRDFFPADAIGGSSKAHVARKAITIDWGDTQPIETDIADAEDKMLFRKRGWFGKFVLRYRLRKGDQVVLKKHAQYEYSIRPLTRESSQTSASS